MRTIKSKWVGARVDDIFSTDVKDYLDAADNLTMGDLVRLGVKEFMSNHPVRARKEGAAVNTSINQLSGEKNE